MLQRLVVLASQNPVKIQPLVTALELGIHSALHLQVSGPLTENCWHLLQLPFHFLLEFEWHLLVCSVTLVLLSLPL